MSILIVFILFILLIVLNVNRIDKSKDDNNIINEENNIKKVENYGYEKLDAVILDKRLWAYVIDSIIIFVVFNIIVVLKGGMPIFISQLKIMILLTSLIMPNSSEEITQITFIEMLIYTIYYFICNLIFDTSLGGYIMRLKTVKNDGSKFSVSEKLIRSFLKVLTCICMGIPFIISSFTRKPLWYDTLLNMKVISRDEEENEQLIDNKCIVRNEKLIDNECTEGNEKLIDNECTEGIENIIDNKYIEDSVDDICLKNNENCYESNNKEDEYISKKVLEHRIIAFCIDLLCMWIIIIVFLVYKGSFDKNAFLFGVLMMYFLIPVVLLFSFVFPGIGLIIFVKFIFELVYYFVCYLVFGNSLGGYIMKLKIVEKDGSKFSISEKFTRSIFKELTCILVIPFIISVFTRKELWYDKSLDTKVILKEENENR